MPTADQVLSDAQTSFDNLLADGTDNKGDIPAEYNLNSGRHRAYVTPDGGARQRVVNRTDLNGASGLVKLENTTSFNDLAKGFELVPSAGEIVEYGTAERYRYVPGYEFQFGVLTVLQNGGDLLRSGQELRIRYGVPGDGYEFRYRAAEDGEHEARLLKGGSVVTESVRTQSEWTTDPFSDTGVQASLSRPVMHRGEFVHYGGGEFKPSVSFLSEAGEQDNRLLTRTGNPNDIATDESNGFVRITYDCSNSAQGGTCLVGDMQAQVHGQVTEVDRTPPHRVRDLGTGTNYTAETWEAVVLARKDTERQNVSVDFQELTFNSSEAAELAVFTVPKETVTWPEESDWFTPAPSNPQDTVVEWAIVPEAERTDFPTRTISQTSETVIEGECLDHLDAEATSFFNPSNSETTTAVKAKLHGDEYGIYAVRFGATSGSVGMMKDTTREDF